MSQAERIEQNPFYVLDLPTTASRAEVERQGQKWLGMLEMNMKQAASYATPLGRFTRTADLVRQAMAELRDPSRRLAHEVWAALPAEVIPEAPRKAPVQGAPAPWAEALEALGWRPER